MKRLILVFYLLINFSSTSNAVIIERFMDKHDLSEDQVNALISSAQPFCERHGIKADAEEPCWDGHILSALDEMSEEARSHVAAQVSRLLPESIDLNNLLIYDVRHFFMELGTIPTEDERQKIVDTALLHIEPGMTLRDRLICLEASRLFPNSPTERDSLLNAVFPLLGQCTDLSYKMTFIRYVRSLPEAEREGILNAALPLFAEGTDMYDKLDVIQSVLDLPEAEREDVCRRAQRFTIDERPEIQSLFEAITRVPLAHRSLVDECTTWRDLQPLQAVFAFYIADNVATQGAFHQNLLRRINTAREAEMEDADQPFDLCSLIAQSRDAVTQHIRIDMGQHVRGTAFQIHNAVAVLVTRDGEQTSLYKAIEQILSQDLGVVAVLMRTAIAGLNGFINDMETKAKAEAEEKEALNSTVCSASASATTEGNAEDVAIQDEFQQMRAAIDKAYGTEDEPYSGEITRLLGLVWPYMQRLSSETQSSWLNLAVQEALQAYGIDQGLSCSKGIQERLTVTGFLESLEGVDPNLQGLSQLAQLSAVLEAEVMVFEGSKFLDEETRQDIAATMEPKPEILKQWIHASAKAYTDNIEGFKQAQHFPSLGQDLMKSTGVQKQLNEIVLPKLMNPDYWDTERGFNDWRAQVQRSLNPAPRGSDTAE